MKKHEATTTPSLKIKEGKRLGDKITTYKDGKLTLVDVNSEFDTIAAQAEEAEFSAIVAHLEDVKETGDEIIREHEDQEAEPRVRAAGKLGRFVASISGAGSKLNAYAMIGVASAIDGAKKVGAAYRKPLEKMEASEDDGRTKRAAKFVGRQAYRGAIGIGVAGGLFAARYGIAEAANITVNGHNGGMNDHFNNTVANSSMGRGQKNIPIRWSSEMGGLFPNEQKTTDQSVAEAGETIDRVRKQNPGGNRFIGYSQGTIALAEYFEKNELGPNDKLVLVGGPYTPGQRLSDNPLVKIIEPGMEGLDIDISQETPGGKNVLYIVSQNDLVGLSKNNKNNPGDIMNRVAGTLAADGHAYNSADLSGATPHTVTRNADGSTTWTLTQSKIKMADGQYAESGIAAALANNNIHVTKVEDKFFQAIRGDENGYWNTDEVASTGAAALDKAAPGAGNVVRQVYNTPGVKEFADQAGKSYMDTQGKVIERTVDLVQNNPAVSKTIKDVAPAVADIASSVSQKKAPNPESVSQALSTVSQNAPALVEAAPQYVADVVKEVAAPVQEYVAPQAPAPVQEYIAPAQPVYEAPVVQNIAPAVNQVFEQVQQVAPQAPPVVQNTLNQAAPILGQFGVK